MKYEVIGIATIQDGFNVTVDVISEETAKAVVIEQLRERYSKLGLCDVDFDVQCVRTDPTDVHALIQEVETLSTRLLNADYPGMLEHEVSAMARHDATTLAKRALELAYLKK